MFTDKADIIPNALASVQIQKHFFSVPYFGEYEPVFPEKCFHMTKEAKLSQMVSKHKHIELMFLLFAGIWEPEVRFAF